ncbi:hypothetical protein BH10PLA2_BH10PLA2_13630 [soil metagenome]
MERQVMEFSLKGEHPVLAGLRDQFTEANVCGREFTGVGFYTDFAIPERALRVPYERLVISDIYADITGLLHGASILIFIENGYLATLECAICEDAWPVEASIGRLYYLRPKEPGSPSLVETAHRDIEYALGGLL